MKTLTLFMALLLLFLSRECFSMYAYITHTDDACNTSSGTATLYVSGGLPPYTMLWSNGSTDATITGIAGGTFLSVWVYDSANDSTYSSVTILAQASLNPTAMSLAGSQPCEGYCNGEARMNFDGLGGTAPYFGTFDGAPMQNITWPMVGLQADNICWSSPGEVYIVDANGCSVTWYQQLYPTPLPEITGVTVTGACNGDNGTVTIIDNSFDLGGAYYYNYYDSAGNNIASNAYTNFIANLAPGNYSVDLTTLIGHLDQYGYSWIITPCTTVSQQFTIPDMGAFCENVSGTVFHDDNLNCSPDAGEIRLSNVVLTFTPGPYTAVTGQQGNYSLNLPSGTYTITQNTPFPMGQICPPVNQTLTVTYGGQIVDYNFSDTSLTPLDLTSFVSATTARPGFDFTYYITASDFSFFNGGQCTITFTYDTALQFVNVSPLPSSQSAGQITWDISTITPFTPFYAGVVLQVPSSMSIGVSLNASANITTVLSETNLSNNTDQLTSITVGSFDPNDKSVRAIGDYPGPQITSAEDLDYTINFQNTGTDTAFNVVVYDTLPSQLNLNSVFVTHATHEYNLVGLNDNVLRFSFENILLPDSGTNEAASHGQVNFRISQQPGNLPGTIINNRAAIVFDFNSPVMTNDATVNVCEFDSTISSVSICNGDSVYAGGTWQHATGTYLDHYSGMYTCDSLVTTELSVIIVDDSVSAIDNVLTALENNAAYQWIDCGLGQAISGATNQSYTATQNGSFAVQITTPENCTIQSVCVEVIGLNATSILRNNLFSIYPNPATDHLVLHSQNATAIQKVFIRNAMNQIVIERSFSAEENPVNEIDLSALSSGVYVISAITVEGSASMRFVKETP